MERFDLQGDLVRALEARGTGKRARKRGDLYDVRCPRHEDRTASAWVGTHRWGCHACGFEEPLDTLAELLGIDVPRRGGFTVEEYAERKGFALDRLRKWGVTTGTSGHGQDIVEIPYFAADGTTVLRAKHRARSKSWWGPGTGTYLYGLWMLAKVAGDVPVIVVEGESDCHACWHHAILAVGVPGATAWKREWAEALAGRPIYLWQEPGEAGVKFVQSLAADFPDARILQSETHKDLADLFRDAGREFANQVEALKAEALPVGITPPAVKFAPLLGPTLDRMLDKKLEQPDAVATMLPSWNRACRDEGGGIGLARGWNVTVAGNTGAGKSLVALNLGAAAISHGERVAYISIEMSAIQLATRTLAIVSGISVRRLEQGAEFSEADWKTASLRMHEIHGRTGGLLFVNEAPIHRLDHITDAIRYQHEVHGCRMVILDYLQLASVTGVRDIVEAVPVISGTVRQLAKDLGVVVVGLSQFNRQTSASKERPTVQGLMGGSPLENDSDQVALLNHAQVEKHGHIAETELLLAKNRHGAALDIPVVWDYRTLTLSEKADRGDAWESA